MTDVDFDEDDADLQAALELSRMEAKKANLNLSEEELRQNALKHNQVTKGNNSYYYAHTRDYEVPENAIIREGPGIITGGAPKLIAASPPPESSATNSPRAPTKPIDKYLLVDEDEKIQV